MDDSIKRQAVIDTVRKIILGLFSEKDGVMNDTEKTLLSVSKAICNGVSELPSAQPEIVRCKDCKFWMPHSQFGYDEDNGTYNDYCAELVPEDEYYAFYRNADDFCSRAERRTDE